MRRTLPQIFAALVASLCLSSFGIGQTCSVLIHNPYTDFNGTKAPSASSAWLNIHTKLDKTDLVNSGDYLLFTGGAISFKGITSTPTVTNLAIPNGKIVADNTVSTPITNYDLGTGTWITRVPPGFSTSDIFIAGAIITSSTGFQVGAGKASTLAGYFVSNRPAFKQSWFYGIGVYQPSFNYSSIGSPGQVTAVGGGDKAGTPLPEKANLVAGGSGGGGSNFTGSYSSTDSYTTCQQTGCNLSISFQESDASCFGGNNGSATVNVTGGTPIFAYFLNGNIVQQSANRTYIFNGLSAGTYNLTVIDVAGCRADISVTVSQPSSALQVSANVIRGDFDNTCNGEATVTVTGGVPPYSYYWSDGVTTSSNTRDNLCGPPAGNGTPVNYTVVVTDSNGCQASAYFTIDVSSNATAAASSSALVRGGLQFGQSTAPFLYPNPSNGIVHLQLNAGQEGKAVVNVVDINGRIVKSVILTLQGGTNTRDLQLPARSGFYMLQINMGKESRTLPVYLLP